MAFMKDPDAHTRGVGAIAAADRNPRRVVKRARAAALTKQRDRAMTRMGRLGLGMAVLGQRSLATTMPTNAGVIVPTSPSASGPLQVTAGVNRSMSTVGMASQSSGPTIITGIYNPTGSPLPAVTTSTTTTVDQGNASSSVSSGTGTPAPSTTSPIVTAPPDDGDAIDGLLAPTVSDPSAPATDNTNLYLLLGGAALAAYLLFFRKKGG